MVRTEDRHSPERTQAINIHVRLSRSPVQAVICREKCLPVFAAESLEATSVHELYVDITVREKCLS